MSKEFEGKKLLVLGATADEADIVRHAQAMGAYVIAADYYEDSPAKKVADEAVLIDALDVDAIVDYCRRAGVDGVTTGFVDILLQPCYEVCRRLGLPCYLTPKMMSMSTNKIDFKETCDRWGVPVPQTYLVGDAVDEATFAALRYPVFVKPVDGSGSRGAGVCYNRKQLEERFAEALSYSADGKAVIEDYVTGREFLLDYIASDGEFRLLSIFDRYMASDRGSAVNYSTISISPSRWVDLYLDQVNDKVIHMFRSEGFTDGVLFLQGFFDGSRVVFYEMGCRLGGSFYNHEQACLGYNALDMIVRYALTGKMVEDISAISKESARYKKYALDCNYLLKGSDETVARIIGLDKIEAMPDCIEIQKFHDVGYHYSKDRTVDRPIMVAEVVADHKEDVKRIVNYINREYDVLNEHGNSLLMEKLDPEVLFQ